MLANSLIKPVGLSSISRGEKPIEQEGAQDASSSESPVFITVLQAARFNARVSYFLQILFSIHSNESYPSA